MIERIQEDKLGDTCRDAQYLIRQHIEDLHKRVMVREILLSYKIEMMIRYKEITG